MVFNSIDYLIFLPVVLLVYYILPKGKLKELRVYWLLIVSYYFYMAWNPKYGLLILLVTAVSYFCGIGIEQIDLHYTKKTKKKLALTVLYLSLMICLGILVYYKYTNFVLTNIGTLLNKLGLSLHIPTFDIILPVGISFFIFQAVGYVIDVYRGSVKAEKNPFRYALFVSFFPQILAGPIQRSGKLMPQINDLPGFDADNVREGFLTIGYGLFMKIVVADNITQVIDPVFDHPESFSGMVILLSVILFAFQIYCDFNGYSQLAIGSAKIMGIDLSKNFEAPYLGKSVKDFWRRWHISLTSWFRDYLYIPLGGNRKGYFRKQLNTLVVFFFSGLWHGAAWHYVVWGVLNGLFSVLEDVFTPVKKKVDEFLHIDSNACFYKVFQRIITFLLIDFTWLFFRAKSFSIAIEMLQKIVNEFESGWFFSFKFLSVFESPELMLTIFISLLVVGLIDVLIYMKKDVKRIIMDQAVLFRWILYVILIFAILYWGVYGNEYQQTQFIYFKF